MGSWRVERLDQLPTALLATIMTKLDISSICSLAVTCRAFNSCASHILSFLPKFHILDISPSMELIKPLLPPNSHLQSLKLDCGQLNDSSIELLLRPSLQELCFHNCADFSGKLLSEIGSRCKDVRSLYLGSVAEKRGRAIHISDLEELLGGCTQLEELHLMFDLSLFLRHNFARVWALASKMLTSLEIGYISSVMVTELLSPNVGPHQYPNQIRPSILPAIQKLSLAVDYITDTMVGTISKGLALLTHLELRDAPLIEPRVTFDLTNSGLQQINQHGRLKHLSLVRSQEFLSTYFKRVNDLGILLMADKCANMESICLGGFCRVTDTGFKTILHSCSSLYKLKLQKMLTSLEIGYISSVMVTELLSPNVGPHQYPNQIRPSILPAIQKLSLAVDYITDTMVGTISKGLTLLTHLELRDAPLIEPRVTFDLTNSGLQQINQHGRLKHLSLVRSQEFLSTYFKRVNDLGILLMADKCANMESICLGGFCRVTDTGFKTILHSCSSLYKLKLDNSDISDVGIAYLRHGIISSLVSLSVRGCKKLTDKCISVLFDGSSKLELQELDLSNLRNLSDNGVLALAKSRVPISELRMRQCPLIGDTSIMALASMQADDDRGHGSSLRLLDLYNCGGITQLSFRWLKKPYFPRLRWLGVTGSVNRDIVDALARNRPFLHVACHGEELGTDPWNNIDSSYMHDYEELDELEQWLQEGDGSHNGL
ncbi:hypothetical protein GOBAR_AA25573 [Gossypium barbadense]|uniref:F-box domain-containing protein n=1 Tax=Gossypium barbadense TaxID=3634 RepID=A0A2P5WVI2_GOSBA|nr:hypothetical protein GOBAR_AA25573 [Gossypium barbadense]